jgi:hypothetical protein
MYAYECMFSCIKALVFLSNKMKENLSIMSFVGIKNNIFTKPYIHTYDACTMHIRTYTFIYSTIHDENKENVLLHTTIVFIASSSGVGFYSFVF